MAGFVDAGVGDLLSIFRLPVIGPVLVDDFERAAFEQRFERPVLALFEKERVVVGLRAVDADEALFSAAHFGESLGDELALQLADADVVEGHVEVEVAVFDEAVVGDDGDAGVVRELHGLSHGVAIVRGDDDDLDAFGDERLHVGHLADVVAVRALHFDLRAEGGGAGDKGVAVALPAFFFQSIERQADARFRVGGRAGFRATFGQNQAGDDAQQAGNEDEREAEFHAGEKGEAAEARTPGSLCQAGFARGSFPKKAHFLRGQFFAQRSRFTERVINPAFPASERLTSTAGTPF